MAVQQGSRAPYASTGSIMKVIEKHRQVGLQTMSLPRLQQIGVTEALAPRTMQALVYLGFYAEDGTVTAEFDALRKVAEYDFKPRLAALLREAYASVLEVLDPATATPLDVENAFRGFEPTGQLPRMVQLFMGLMIYAGVMPEDRRKAPPASNRPVSQSRAGAAAGKKKDTRTDGGDQRVRETGHETPPPSDDGHGPGFVQADGDTFMLYLVSGPKITLTVKMDVMRTSVADRDFIFKLIDALRDYDTEPEQTSGAPAGGAGKASAKSEDAA